MEKRVAYLDLTRAIAVIFVLWLHVGTAWQTADDFVHVFHMPVFFVISGMCFKDRVSFRKMLKRKSRTLLFPYFVYGTLLYFFWTALFTAIDKERAEPLSQYFMGMFYNNADISPYNCIQWFFTALFFSNMLFFAILKITKNKKTYVLLLSILSGITGYLSGFLPFRLPLSTDIAFMCCFFMGVGYIIREIDIKWYFIPVLAVLAVTAFIVNPDTIWNMRTLDFGNPVLYMIGSTSLSIMVITICRYLSKIPDSKVTGLFCFLGRNSLWFLVYNQFLIMAVRLIQEGLKITIPTILICVLVMILLIPLILLENKISFVNRPDQERA